MSSQQLKEYFGFDDADLNANKVGQLTEKQKVNFQKELKSDRTWSRVFGVLLIGVAAIFPLSFFGPCIFGGNCKTDSGIGAIIGAVVLIGVNLIWVGIWGGIGLVLIIGSSNKQGYKLKLVEGPVNIVERTSTDSEHHTTHHYEMHISGTVFNVTSNLADIMMQGDIYAVYYLADADADSIPSKVLSAEQILQKA